MWKTGGDCGSLLTLQVVYTFTVNTFLFSLKVLSVKCTQNFKALLYSTRATNKVQNFFILVLLQYLKLFMWLYPSEKASLLFTLQITN